MKRCRVCREWGNELIVNRSERFNVCETHLNAYLQRVYRSFGATPYAIALATADRSLAEI